MTRSFRNIAALGVFIAIANPIATLAQRGATRGSSMPAYDVAKEVTVSGEFVASEMITLPSGQPYRMLNLKVKGKTTWVYVAPEGYAKDKESDLAFAAGATVEAIGSAGPMVKADSAIMARQLKTGSRTVMLRSATGVPVWER